jgi:transposase
VVAAIGTGEAFERGRDFGAWLGLVPRQYNTGGQSILGRISKRGSKYLRTLFIQAANVVWLLNAAPRLHRNKLATALANKLARIAWSILRNEKTFDLNLSAQHRTPEFSDQEPLKANGVRDPVKAPQREPGPRRDP